MALTRVATLSHCALNCVPPMIFSKFENLKVVSDKGLENLIRIEIFTKITDR